MIPTAPGTSPGDGSRPEDRHRRHPGGDVPPGGDAPPGDDVRTARRRPAGRGAGERSVVPDAEFRSYYGKPVVKAPVWRRDIPAYLFTGGLAAGSALLGAGADATGRPGLRRAGRLTALGAVAASTYFLVNDLGRPERFHHMLRVVKPTSPMSVGTWILSAFGATAGLAAAAEVTPARGLGRVARPAGRAAGYAAAVVAPGLATYTAVLLADTAVPSWHEAYPELPFVFAGSSLASAAGVGLMAAPLEEAGPARGMAVAGVAMEVAGLRRIEHGLGLLSEPYRAGRPGRLLRAGRILAAAGGLGALLSRRNRVVSVLAGAALVAGSVATRFGVYEGGVASARDPKYTVVPQRHRIEQAGQP